MIIGASTHSVEEAVRAQDDGASYINIGPLFPTKTKKWDAEFIGLEGLKKISALAKIPFTVMGGIKEEHIRGLVAAGARTLAVVTAITAAPDPEHATREFLAELNRVGYKGSVSVGVYNTALTRRECISGCKAEIRRVVS
jgi:thiamine-phosphate pyrophosphorylase